MQLWRAHAGYSMMLCNCFYLPIFAFLSTSVTGFPLPEGVKITPEWLVQVALENSDEAALIENDLTSLESKLKRLEANFVTRMDAKVAFSDSRAASSQPFSPERSQSELLSIGVSRGFESGTVLRGDIQAQKRDLKFSSPSELDGDAFETSLSVSLRQSLWKNQFGETFGKMRESIKHLSQATESSVKDRKSSYSVQIAGVFFRAWQYIAQTKSVQEKLARQKRLLSITKVKFDRGMAEKPDLLQAETAVTLTEERLSDARKNVDDIWRQLVATLKLNKALAETDPMDIPIDLGDALNGWQKSCEKADIKNLTRSHTAQRHLNAAESNVSAVRSSMKPDLYVEARYGVNGIDPRFNESSQEATAAKHPAGSIVVGIELMTGYSQEEGELLESLQQKRSAEIRLSQIQSQYETDLPIRCEEIERLELKQKTLVEVLKKQKARAEGEEERFSLGKVDSFNVIQAENDMTDVQSALDGVLADLYRNAWELLYLSDRLETYMKAQPKKALTL